MQKKVETAVENKNKMDKDKRTVYSSLPPIPWDNNHRQMLKDGNRKSDLSSRSDSNQLPQITSGKLRTTSNAPAKSSARQTSPAKSTPLLPPIKPNTPRSLQTATRPGPVRARRQLAQKTAAGQQQQQQQPAAVAQAKPKNISLEFHPKPPAGRKVTSASNSCSSGGSGSRVASRNISAKDRDAVKSAGVPRPPPPRQPRPPPPRQPRPPAQKGSTVSENALRITGVKRRTAASVQQRSVSDNNIRVKPGSNRVVTGSRVSDVGLRRHSTNGCLVPRHQKVNKGLEIISTKDNHVAFGSRPSSSRQSSKLRKSDVADEYENDFEGDDDDEASPAGQSRPPSSIPEEIITADVDVESRPPSSIPEEIEQPSGDEGESDDDHVKDSAVSRQASIVVDEECPPSIASEESDTDCDVDNDPNPDDDGDDDDHAEEEDKVSAAVNQPADIASGAYRPLSLASYHNHNNILDSDPDTSDDDDDDDVIYPRDHAERPPSSIAEDVASCDDSEGDSRPASGF